MNTNNLTETATAAADSRSAGGAARLGLTAPRA